MKRSKSSRRWLKDHFKDEYVKKAQVEGKRSRAAYKLIQLQNKDKIIKSNMTVVELGAAPGSWTELLAKWTKPDGKVIAVDKLSINPIYNVEFIQGDFTDSLIHDRVLEVTGSQKVDAVISDMAPNTSGITAVDQAKMIALNEMTLDFACNNLKKLGSFCIKTYQGEGFEALLKRIRQEFNKVFIRKPEASRAQSRELYIVAKEFKKD